MSRTKKTSWMGEWTSSPNWVPRPGRALGAREAFGAWASASAAGAPAPELRERALSSFELSFLELSSRGASIGRGRIRSGKMATPMTPTWRAPPVRPA